jgi:mannosylglycoprotein endo-beta-mannosidase
LEEYISISLSNYIYKIISIIISRRIKWILPKSISQKQFGFLEGRQIHEAIGVSQEAMHIIKNHKIKGAVLKIDLSKAYDRVSWIFLRMLLTHLGFVLPFINWVMRCISSVYFAVLINGVASPSLLQREGSGRDAPYPCSFFWWWKNVLAGPYLKQKIV